MFKFTAFFAQATGTLALLQSRDIAPHVQDHAIDMLGATASDLSGTGGGEPHFADLAIAGDNYLVARKAGNPLLREQMEYLSVLKDTIAALSQLALAEVK